jgi:hypothetical protein
VFVHFSSAFFSPPLTKHSSLKSLRRVREICIIILVLCAFALYVFAAEIATRSKF